MHIKTEYGELHGTPEEFITLMKHGKAPQQAIKQPDENKEEAKNSAKKTVKKAKKTKTTRSPRINWNEKLALAEKAIREHPEGLNLGEITDIIGVSKDQNSKLVKFFTSNPGFYKDGWKWKHNKTSPKDNRSSTNDEVGGRSERMTWIHKQVKIYRQNNPQASYTKALRAASKQWLSQQESEANASAHTHKTSFPHIYPIHKKSLSPLKNLIRDILHKRTGTINYTTITTITELQHGTWDKNAWDVFVEDFLRQAHKINEHYGANGKWSYVRNGTYGSLSWTGNVA